jgi:hypothetical protein
MCSLHFTKGTHSGWNIWLRNIGWATGFRASCMPKLTKFFKFPNTCLFTHHQAYIEGTYVFNVCEQNISGVMTFNDENKGLNEQTMI